MTATSLPSGTVTFLFSDIEGSTRHAHRLGDDAWAALLRTHDRLIDDAVTAHGGVVVKHEGDGAFAGFSDAGGALDAAVDIARGITGDALGDTGAAVRVRMGLHTGDGRTTDSGADYVGIDVHYAARVAAAGNGGQIVLSASTLEAVGGSPGAPSAASMPDGSSVVDEGPRRLKDFDEPRPLYRLVIVGIADDDRPLRTEDLPTNLPALATSFVGREAEITRLADLMTTSRLVTLTGPGGTGKTRLGVGLAEAIRGRFAGGTWFVDLAPVRDPELIPAAIATVLGVREEAGVPIATSLRETLRTLDALLLLDNLEQLLPAGSDTVATLLREAPGLRIVVTSREVLRITGEHEHPVPPLDQDEGVTLFLERARSRRMDIGDTPADRDVAARIVTRLGGLPLAIELAAARTRLMTPTAVLDRLGESLDVLAGGARDLPERQRTLRGTVAWSHDLLTDAEQRIFRRASVFNGGCTASVAEAVVDPSAELSLAVIDGLESLADKSLVRIEITDHGEPRFSCHVLIREYALERLTEAGERPDCERRHAMSYLDIAEAATPHLLADDSARWLDLLEHDEHNLRAAIRWSLDHGEPVVGMRIATAIWRFWQRRDRLEEGLAWTATLLEQGGSADARTRIGLLAADGGMAYWNDDFDRCRARYSERLALATELADPLALAEAHYDLGFLGMVDQDLEFLREHEEIALRLFTDGDDQGGIVRARQALVLSSFLTGEYRAARELETQNLARFREMGAAYRLHDSEMLLATAAIFEGDLEAGRSHLLASERLTSGAAQQISGVAIAAHLALRMGEDDVGARLAGAARAATAATGQINAVLSILHVADPVDTARERMGAAAEVPLAEGAAMSLDAAVAMALDLLSPG
jgi:predicted ATPase/class 3 adenylate cyclase